ncbi:MAG: hypothetical protein KIT45_05950 [Fimbriimonadia bacterium]|nr:hypothetical protein [Fimbriimonadia bacterium]
MHRMRLWLSVESWAIMLICIADLLTTLVFLKHGMAEEGNPVMKFYLDQGVWAFIAAKALLVLGPLTVIEWARRRRPITVRWLARGAVAGYVGIYASLFLHVNVPRIMASDSNSTAEIVVLNEESVDDMLHRAPSHRD